MPTYSQPLGGPFVGVSYNLEPPIDLGTSPNYTRFEEDGTMVAVGEAVTWNDINISLIPPSAGASPPDPVPLNGSTYTLVSAFAGTGVVVERVQSSLEILHGYKEGSDIMLHVHWMPTVADTGNVTWGFEYQWWNRGEVAPSPTTTTVTTSASGAAWLERTSAITISGSGKKMGSRFAFALFRDPANPLDTYAQDAAVTDIGIHYESDTMGSRQMLVK